MADTKMSLIGPFDTIKAFANSPRQISIPTITIEDEHRKVPLSLKSPVQSDNLERPSRFREHLEPSTTEKGLLYHLHTCLLFTYSDLKNILVPQTLLAVVTALACTQRSPSNPSTFTQPRLSVVLCRIPLAALWIWLHLLLFTTSNQTQPASLTEDTQNKPFRPLPSGRVTFSSARRLFHVTAILCIIYSILFTDRLRETIVFQALTFLNNDLALGDSSFVTRNILNSAGYTTFAMGAFRVLLKDSGRVASVTAYPWLVLLAAIVLTTGHVQDLQDLEGDTASGRKTLPILTGEAMAQWSILLHVACWMVVVPQFWNCGVLSSLIVLTLGGIVVGRLAKGNDTSQGYKTTYKLWTCWVVMMYFLPLLAKA